MNNPSKVEPNLRTAPGTTAGSPPTSGPPAPVAQQGKPTPPANRLKMYRVKVGSYTHWNPDSPVPTEEEYATGTRRKEKTWRPGEVAVTEVDLIERFGGEKFEFLGFYTKPEEVPEPVNPVGPRGTNAGHRDYTKNELEALSLQEIRALAEAEDIAVRGTTKQHYVESILASQSTKRMAAQG